MDSPDGNIIIAHLILDAAHYVIAKYLERLSSGF